MWSIIPSSDVVRELPENEKNIGFSVEVPHLGKNYHSDLWKWENKVQKNLIATQSRLVEKNK